MAEFQQRDPLSPAFWDERFERSFTPWDQGGVPQALRDFAAGHAAMSTLIPGCGSAYELAFLAQQGWDATAIDFSPVAVAQGRAVAGRHAARVVEADFFTWLPQAPLQLIYERAFLCAMPHAMRPQVAQRWAQLLSPGALLAGFFFFDDAPKGPPFGISREQLDTLLEKDFICVEDREVSDA